MPPFDAIYRKERSVDPRSGFGGAMMFGMGKTMLGDMSTQPERITRVPI